MTSSQLTYNSNKDVFFRNFARNTTFANKQIHAKMQPTRGWMLE